MGFHVQSQDLSFTTTVFHAWQNTMIRDEDAAANAAMIVGCMSLTSEADWQQGMATVIGVKSSMVPRLPQSDHDRLMAEFNASAGHFGVEPKLDEPGLESNFDPVTNSRDTVPCADIPDGSVLAAVELELVPDEGLESAQGGIESALEADSDLSHTVVLSRAELVKNTTAVAGMWYHFLVGLVHQPSALAQVSVQRKYLKVVFGSATPLVVSGWFLEEYRIYRKTKESGTQEPGEQGDGAADSDGESTPDDFCSTLSRKSVHTSDHVGNEPTVEHFNIATLPEAPPVDLEPQPDDVLRDAIVEEANQPKPPDDLIGEIKSGHFDKVLRGEQKSRPELEAAAERKKNPGIRRPKDAPKKKQHKEHRSDRGSTVVSLSTSTAQAENDMMKHIESLNARVSGLEGRVRDVENKVDGLQQSINSVTSQQKAMQAQQKAMQAEQHGMLRLLMQVAKAVGAEPQQGSQSDQQEMVESDTDTDVAGVFSFPSIFGNDVPTKPQAPGRPGSSRDSTPATPAPPSQTPRPRPAANPVASPVPTTTQKKVVPKVVRQCYKVSHFVTPHSYLTVMPDRYPNITNPRLITKEEVFGRFRALCQQRYKAADINFRKNFEAHNCSEIHRVLRILDDQLRSPT